MQIMDRAFMTGVLLMTTCWQKASGPSLQAQQSQTTGSPSSSSNAKRNRKEAKHSSDKQTSAHFTAGKSDSSSATDSSSVIAAELLDNLSYLQFCRMRLTAYNSLLKSLLTAVSTSAQVETAPTHTAYCCLLTAVG